jgi:rhodanese-related sulfurtransferase
MLMQRLAPAAAAALMLLSINACSDDSAANLAAPEAYAQVEAGQLTLIDIRRPDEWRQTGVAKGAVRINMAHPQGPAGFVHQVAAEVDGDTSAPIALICRTGNRSTHMLQALRQAGFTNVYNVKEGMAGSGAGPGWIKRGLPIDPCPAC